MSNPFSPQDNAGLWPQPANIVPLTFGQLGRQAESVADDHVTIPRETANSLKALLLSMADTFARNDMPDIAIQAKAVASLI